MRLFLGKCGWIFSVGAVVGLFVDLFVEVLAGIGGKRDMKESTWTHLCVLWFCLLVFVATDRRAVRRLRDDALPADWWQVQAD
jgi:hypothetical protein